MSESELKGVIAVLIAPDGTLVADGSYYGRSCWPCSSADLKEHQTEMAAVNLSNAIAQAVVDNRNFRNVVVNLLVAAGYRIETRAIGHEEAEDG